MQNNFKNFRSRLYSKLKISSSITYIDNKKFYLRSNGASINDELFKNKTYSFHIASKFNEEVKNDANGSLFINIGANIGTSVRNLNMYFSNIVAIEPEYENYKYLRKNTVNTDIKLMHTAIGNYIGFTHLNINPISNGKNSIDRSDYNSKVETIPIITLDALNLNPKFLLIDVEGHEIEVLKGAEKSLYNIEMLCVEIDLQKNKKRKELFSILEKYFDRFEIYYNKDWKQIKFQEIEDLKTENCVIDIFAKKHS